MNSNLRFNEQQVAIKRGKLNSIPHCNKLSKDNKQSQKQIWKG